MINSSCKFNAPKVSEHLLHSESVGDVFKIRVLIPICRSDGTERFPVIYTTDGDDFFGALTDISNMLQVLGEAPRFILVGIGYQDTSAARLLRMRDFLTHSIRAHYKMELIHLADSPLINSTRTLRDITETTDAKEFLSFIRDELIPFVDNTYPTLQCENNYAGYSAGAGFGLYTLFREPDTFKRYILGSPSTSHSGHHFGIELAKSFVESGRELKNQVFISVGELEEFDRGMGKFDLVTGYYLLAKYLTSAEIRGLDLTLRVFPGEIHATSWLLSFSHGVRALFGRQQNVPYLPNYFNE